MSEKVFINLKNRSHTISAEVQISEGGARGVILAQAGRFGGWSLYLKDDKPTYTYNFLGLQRFTIAAPKPVPAGKAAIRFEFAYDGEGLGKVPDVHVEEKRVNATHIEEASPGSGPSFLIRIHSLRETPSDAFAAAPYRTAWFWIIDRISPPSVCFPFSCSYSRSWRKRTAGRERPL